MRKSPSIARVWGIPVRLHWSFLVLLALVVLDYSSGPVGTMLAALAWFFTIFASVLVHELAHCAVARHRDLVVEDILLLPIGGVSEIPRLKRGSRDEFVVALAGPLSSLSLGVVLVIGSLLAGLRVWPPTMMTGSFVVRVAWANLLLGGFNLLPVLPLDGGHVLRADLARRRPESSATLIASKAGIVVGYAMVVAGIFLNIWIAIIGLFIVLGGSAERRIAVVRELLGDRRVRDVMIPSSRVLEASATVAESAEVLLARPGHSIPVVQEGRYVGMVSTVEIAGAQPDVTLDQLVDRGAPLLMPEDDLYPDAVAAFSAARRQQLAVGLDGTVVGLLYESDVQSLLRRAERAMRPSG